MIKNTLYLPALVAVSLFFYLLFSIIILTMPPYRAVGQIWNGYYTILVREGTVYERFLKLTWEQILRRSVPDQGLVAEETQQVSFTNFESLENVGLKDLQNRFDPQDPRLDSYMKGLEDFFRGDDGWRRIYVPSRTPVFQFFLMLSGRFPGHGKNWRVVDFNIYGKLVSILLSLIFFMAILYLKRDFKLKGVVALGFVPWIFCIISGDFHDLLSFYLLFSAWYLVLEESLDYLTHWIFFNWRDPDVRRLQGKYVFFGVVFLLTLLIRIPGSRGFVEVLRNLLPLIADFCLMAALLLRALYRARSSGHMVFTPVPIIHQPDGEGMSKIALSVLWVPLVLTPFLLQLGNPGSHVFVPVPRYETGSASLSWDSLRALWTVRSEDDLPDLAGYVAHMAYQEGLSFGAVYAFPERNGDITVSTYSRQAGRAGVVKGSEVVKRYDDAWLGRILKGPPVGSLERMLIDQKKAARVVLLPAGSTLPGYSIWKCGILALFGFFIFFSFDFMWKPVLIYSDKNLTELAA